MNFENSPNFKMGTWNCERKSQIFEFISHNFVFISCISDFFLGIARNNV